MINLDRYIIIALFTGYMGKLLISGANYADVGVVLVMAAAHFLYNSQIQNKQIVQLKQELKDSEARQAERMTALETSVAEHRTYISSIKISQGIKTVR